MEAVNSIFAIYAIAFLQLFFDSNICNNANAWADSENRAGTAIRYCEFKKQDARLWIPGAMTN
jgi:hypothetical protein